MTPEGAILLAGIAAIFVSALLAPAAVRILGERAPVLLGFVPLAGFCGFAALLPAVRGGGAVRVSFPWVPSLGISLSFSADGLSLLFLLAVSLIGAFVVWYAGGYLAGKKDLGRFLLFLFGFMGSMLGLVAADNLILLFIFWELTGITSYLLIGYYCEGEDSRRSALQALLVTGGGGLAMLAGFIVLGLEAGTYELSSLLALPRGQIASSPHFFWIFGLVIVGAFTKSAQFPFHFWLPNAMAAPAPVSAFLHSATMVKAGVFLLARLFPCLSPSPLWTPVLGGFGAATMLLGAGMALGQNDIKKVLAYTTVAVLGTLTMLLGIGSELAVKAAMTYLLAHALYKAALFMAAGSIDHETGTRDVEGLGGLRAAMPFTAFAAALGALSMAGLPFLLGFVSKEYFYKALLGASPPFLWEVMGLAASSCLVAMAFSAGIKPFFGHRIPTPNAAHEVPARMWVGPLALGLLAIKMGVFPGILGGWVIVPAAASVLGDPGFDSHLALWHGFGPALALSAATLILGIALFAGGQSVRRIAASAANALSRFGPERAYDFAMVRLVGACAAFTRFTQGGYLRVYVLLTGGFAAVLALAFFPPHGLEIDLGRMAPIPPPALAICAIMVGGAFFACLARSRFAAIMALGVVGLGVAVIYFLFGAPDLAMTQILVETLTLVLFVAAFFKLPLFGEFSSRRMRARDAVLALGFGALMCALVLAAFHFAPSGQPVSNFMRENSLPAANGRNVVNVILVDFRALDTLGEICVLAVAALGVAAILKLRPGKK